MVWPHKVFVRSCSPSAKPAVAVCTESCRMLDKQGTRRGLCMLSPPYQWGGGLPAPQELSQHSGSLFFGVRRYKSLWVEYLHPSDGGLSSLVLLSAAV